MARNDNTMTNALLAASLSCSVPLYAMDLVKKPWSFVMQRVGACADVVASKGDIILYRSKKRRARQPMHSITSRKVSRVCRLHLVGARYLDFISRTRIQKRELLMGFGGLSQNSNEVCMGVDDGSLDL